MESAFDWFFLANQADFLATGLTSFEGEVVMNGVIEKVLFTRGDYTSIFFKDTFLSIGMNNRNPFRIGEYAVFLDASDDIWLGVYNEN